MLNIKPKEPTKPRTVGQGISLTIPQRDKLAELADHYEVTMSRVVQQLIEQAWDSHKKEEK